MRCGVEGEKFPDTGFQAIAQHARSSPATGSHESFVEMLCGSDMDEEEGGIDS